MMSDESWERRISISTKQRKVIALLLKLEKAGVLEINTIMDEETGEVE